MDHLPGTATGGVADPMTTKLEMLVGYLAGRQGKAAESIRRKLEDPTSEASRWLEAVRNRSRAVTRAGSPRAQDLIAPASMRNGMTTRGPAPARKRLLPLLSGVSVAALVLIAMGVVAWRARDDRLLRLETMLTEREARWGSRFDQLDAATHATRGGSAREHARLEGISRSPGKASGHGRRTDGFSAARGSRPRLGEVGERLRESQIEPEPE